MSFYHILPSNTSPTYFPKNNASQYSTPVENPYDLSGSWELALMNMTYANCVKTFNNDVMVVDETCTVDKFLSKATKPVKVMLSIPPPGEPRDVINQIAQEINMKFKGLLSLAVTKDKKYITWKFEQENAYIILSQTLQRNIFNLWSDVLTWYDLGKSNYFPAGVGVPADVQVTWHDLGKANYHPVGHDVYGYVYPKHPEDMFIIWLPKSCKKETIVVKAANEAANAKTVLQEYNSKVPQTISSLILEDKKFKTNKLHNDKYVVIYSKEFVKALHLRHSGQFHKDIQKYLPHDLSDAFKFQWSVMIYSLDEIIPYSPKLSREVVLPPITFKKQSDAIPFINKHINDPRIVFSCNKRNYVQLKITDRSLMLTFSNTLRDIFAFDKNTYGGVGTFSASDIFSLSRRIQYLYVYSNIGEFVRIGDTEAPLLAVVPFNTNEACQLLSEKVFKMPMYVRLMANLISQIDIGIYDGAGQPVPFIDDAVTTLRFHFRQMT